MAGPTTLDPLLINSFGRMVTRAPQNPSVTKDAVYVESGITGTDHRFPAKGKAWAGTHAPLQIVQATPTEKVKPVAQLSIIQHIEFLDDTEMTETNVKSIMANYAMDSRDAVERGIDSKVFTALATPNTDSLGQPNTALANTTLDRGAIAEGVAVLLNKGYGVTDQLSLFVSAQHFESLIKIAELMSRDFTQKGMAQSGIAPRLFGVAIKQVEARQTQETGVAVADGYLIAKRGVGLAVGNERKMPTIERRVDMFGWQVGARLNCGSTTILRDSVVRFNALTV